MASKRAIKLVCERLQWSEETPSAYVLGWADLLDSFAAERDATHESSYIEGYDAGRSDGKDEMRGIEANTIMRFRKMLNRIGIHGYYNEMQKEFDIDDENPICGEHFLDQNNQPAICTNKKGHKLGHTCHEFSIPAAPMCIKWPESPCKNCGKPTADEGGYCSLVCYYKVEGGSRDPMG